MWSALAARLGSGVRNVAQALGAGQELNAVISRCCSCAGRSGADGGPPPARAEAAGDRGSRLPSRQSPALRPCASRRGAPAVEDFGDADAARLAVAAEADLIQRIFRSTHILVTLKRDELLRDGRGEELDGLVRATRMLQESVTANRPMTNLCRKETR